MYPNRCQTCLKVLQWTEWRKDHAVPLLTRLEKHGYVRLCCRNMMLTCTDMSEDWLGLINTERCMQNLQPISNEIYKRWFPDAVVIPSPPPAPLPSSSSALSSSSSSSVSRIHMCV